MTATIVDKNHQCVVVQIEISLDADSLLELEEGLQRSLNEAGQLGTQELLSKFGPTHQNPIVHDHQKWNFKGKVAKQYETLSLWQCHF